MLAIEVELLTGRYAATAYNDRTRAEWPPHPARLFSALVAALHDHDPVDVEERAALVWLEQQSAPSLDVDLVAARRSVLDTFVPVNDTTLLGDVDKRVRELREAEEEIERVETHSQSPAPAALMKKAQAMKTKAEKSLAQVIADQAVPDAYPSKVALSTAEQLLPDRRTRQARTFPVAVPERPWFVFVWSTSVPDDKRPPLARLCARVTRLGHSSSLVRCAPSDRVPSLSLIPDALGEDMLRWVSAGQLDRLETEFKRHRAEQPRILPSYPVRFGRPRSAVEIPAPSSVFSDQWIVFERVGGARPQASKAHALCRALRDSLIEQNGTEDLPTELSGHAGGGGPARQPHLAFVALPFVGSEHADGSLQGCALVLPRGIDEETRLRLMRLVAKWEKARESDSGQLELASHGLPPIKVQRVEVSEKHSLRESTWSRPSRRFTTATPIALDRNPGNLRSNESGAAARAAAAAQACVADACERIGLPRPIEVEISSAPLLRGAQPARAFHPFPIKPGRFRRVLVHAEIHFAEPVSGPILLGAGRYMGLGLCRPASGPNG